MDIFGIQSLYLYLDPDYYETLDKYRPQSSEYLDCIRALIPSGWTVNPSGIWCMVTPPSDEMPDQGFKIHVSAVPTLGRTTLERCVAPCIAMGVPFKFLIDPIIHGFANGKSFSRPQSGKFITIYPADESSFKSLLEALHEKTRDLDGPYILSDWRYPGSRVLFYRYGGFRRITKLDIRGYRTHQIVAPDGTLVEDQRRPYPQHPPWVHDPFAQNLDYPTTIVLKERYEVEDVLNHANTGGVYRARDRISGQTVVLKEARPHIGSSVGWPWDAVTLLKHEFDILKTLEETGFAPRAFDIFQEWENWFLVEEFIPGDPLTQFRAWSEFNPILQQNPNEDDLRRFCRIFSRITRQLCRALKEFHRRGIIFGDLSPSNIIISPKSFRVKFIDFEGAYRKGDEIYVPLFTPGFVSKRRMVGQPPRPEDDWYALGHVLYSMILPVEGLFYLNPGARSKFMDEITRDYGYPTELKNWIFRIMQGKNGFFSLTRLRKPRTPHRRTNRRAVQLTLNRITDEILHNMQTERDDRLWPADPHVFESNPLNISSGALGIATFLKKYTGNVPDKALRWIRQSSIDLESYPPGLYVGLAGVAWALDLMGERIRAEEAMRLVASSPLRGERPDIFYGASGWGLAALYFYRRTGEKTYLDMARQAADIVHSLVSKQRKGWFWPDPEGDTFYGYAHGASGMAYFFLKCFETTQNQNDLETARSLLNYDLAHAIREGHARAWSYSEKNKTLSPYWRVGTAGVGSVLIRFYRTLGDRRYLRWAEQAARYLRVKYAVTPGQFMGLAGIGEFMVDMYTITGNKEYLRQAWRLAHSILLFRIPRKHGYAFPGRDLFRISYDFSTGSAGIGIFLHRLMNPAEPRIFYDF